MINNKHDELRKKLKRQSMKVRSGGKVYLDKDGNVIKDPKKDKQEGKR
jgi:hypothetical protein